MMVIFWTWQAYNSNKILIIQNESHKDISFVTIKFQYYSNKKTDRDVSKYIYILFGRIIRIISSINKYRTLRVKKDFAEVHI